VSLVLHDRLLLSFRLPSTAVQSLTGTRLLRVSLHPGCLPGSHPPPLLQFLSVHPVGQPFATVLPVPVPAHVASWMRLLLARVEAASGATSVNAKRECRICHGAQSLPCSDCGGLGRLPRGGYHQKRNSFSAERLLGSKWTARERVFGR